MSLGLVGSIKPFIGNLSFLQSLQLQNNQLTGSLPDQICSLFRLLELKVMDLSMNELGGRLPSQMGLLLNLLILNLRGNTLRVPYQTSLLFLDLFLVS
ncbi:LRR receptor kinase SERL2 [Linum perenne]